MENLSKNMRTLQSQAKDEMQDISVVIPVHDDHLLPHAILSVPTDVELIISMTAPTEQVQRVAKQFELYRNNLIIVDTHKLGMSAGVNLGVRTASNQKIIILDSDCILETQTVGEFSKALDKYEFVRGKTFAQRRGGWSEFAGLGQESLNEAFAHKARLIGPSIAFLKDPFFNLGGYDEECGPSCDHEFVLRMEDRGIVTGFAEQAIVWHQPYTFLLDCRAHLGYGRGMRYIDIKRGGYYGLGICLLRWRPSVLWNKFTHRGTASVFRSLLLGGLMLYSYSQSTIKSIPMTPFRISRRG
jgi:glycosyltransferase involved in cell wall biosynthesis